MAVRFSRVFRNIARCFPGAGASWQGPSTVSDGVLYTEGLFRPSICQDLTFKIDFQTAATGGVATALNHAEPAPGNIHVPIMWTVAYDGIVNISAQALMVRSANPTENWGGWFAAAAGTTANLGTYRVGSVAAQMEAQLFQALPYMRGYSLRVNFPAPAAATNVNSTLWVIEMPIELASIETWKAMPPNFTWTRALP